MVEKIKQRIIFQVTFRRKSIASANRVNMGRAATIIEALDAVVYRSPLFSREKYITIPKKLARTIYPMSLRPILNEVLVKRTSIIRVDAAMICLKNAIDTVGICYRTTLVLLKEKPQNKTSRIMNNTAN